MTNSEIRAKSLLFATALREKDLPGAADFLLTLVDNVEGLRAVLIEHQYDAGDDFCSPGGRCIGCGQGPNRPCEADCDVHAVLT